MAKLSVGQIIQIVANLGVIASIVFLAVEIRQNNELMEAEARFNRVQLSWDGWQSLAEHGDLTALTDRAGAGDSLQAAEQLRVDAVLMRILVAMEWSFRELPETSPEREYLGDELKTLFGGIGADLRVWEQRKSGFDPEFVRWVEETVLE